MRPATILPMAGARRVMQRRCGAAAAELAVVLPFIALLFGAAADYARVYYYAQTLAGCAEVGALYASGTVPIPSSSQSPADAAKSAACAEGASLQPPLLPEQVQVTSDATTVTVTVTYHFTMVTPLLVQSRDLALTRSVTMAQAPNPWK